TSLIPTITARICRASSRFSTLHNRRPWVWMFPTCRSSAPAGASATPAVRQTRCPSPSPPPSISWLRSLHSSSPTVFIHLPSAWPLGTSHFLPVIPHARGTHDVKKSASYAAFVSSWGQDARFGAGPCRVRPVSDGHAHSDLWLDLLEPGHLCF